jgi:hypothetical protein
MSRTRPGGLPAGLAWVVALAALGWLGLGVSGPAGAPRAVLPAVAAQPAHIAPTAPTAPIVSTWLRVGDLTADRWFHEPMTFSWTASQSDSGIASCLDGFVRKVNASWNQELHLPCVVGPVHGEPGPAFFRRYDGTAPTLDPVAMPDVVAIGGVVAVRPRGVDGLSGIDREGCNGGRAPTTLDLGTHSVSCFARDRAGNEATASVSYLVVARPARKP